MRGRNQNKNVFKWAIPVVFDTITNDSKMSLTQLVHVLFIYKV
jgi:hypothetical protein